MIIDPINKPLITILVSISLSLHVTSCSIKLHYEEQLVIIFDMTVV
jgi:hypothetical protein